MNLGIYIQVPFCQTKCTYCNFHTGVVSKSLYNPYADAVCREIRENARFYQSAGVSALVGAWHAVPALTADTVYIGGGTPSLFEPAALARILDAIRATFDCALEEVTLEADPETVTEDHAAAWRAAGISRVSFGAQSFNDAELKAAGRMHRREDIYRANDILRGTGFGNLSFDLLAGLPHQTAASWEDSIDRLLGLRPEHVSIYLLEVDEGSRLGRELLTLGTRYNAREVPDDEEMVAFYDRARERLAAAGYAHYEISNWALPGFESRHNLKYWRREPYFGFGAGAHSFNGQQRWANTHDPAEYAAAISNGRLPVEQLETLTSGQALEEELFLGLRQLQGIDLARLEAQYNVQLAPRLERLREEGLVEVEGTRARLAPSRLTVSNEVFAELLD